MPKPEPSSWPRPILRWLPDCKHSWQRFFHIILSPFTNFYSKTWRALLYPRIINYSGVHAFLHASQMKAALSNLMKVVRWYLLQANPMPAFVWIDELSYKVWKCIVCYLFCVGGRPVLFFHKRSSYNPWLWRYRWIYLFIDIRMPCRYLIQHYIHN